MQCCDKLNVAGFQRKHPDVLLHITTQGVEDRVILENQFVTSRSTKKCNFCEFLSAENSLRCLGSFIIKTKSCVSKLQNV